MAHGMSPAGRDPVAIVGIGCHLPGAATVAEFWELLVTGRDTVGEIPVERFDIDTWYDPTPGLPGRIATRWGGFLPDVDRFDAPFFGMSAHEATRLDPQHRQMLRTVWEAVEDAGLPAERLAGTRTGVYTSCLASDYWDNVRAADMLDMDAATGTGSWGLPAGRISRLLDLRGPSMGVEATCATSLLAVHLACRDIWSGQTTLAIVSAANLLLGPDLYFSLSESEILSPTGRSRFGEAAVDGYVRSEGAVTVVLKPLADALRDGDRVYAAIRGTGVNNNGRTSETMIAPGVAGQRDMLRAAFRDAGVDPAEVDYVEAHGAGTPRGDEVELTALTEALRDRPADRPCLVGSVKSNIGHTEAAAGLTGLVKAALAVHHRTVPASLHVERPHRLLAAGSPLSLVTRTRPWPETGRPAVAGVSSFGLSATNVHVVLTGVSPAPVTGVGGGARSGAVLLPLSARDPGALRALAGRYADLLDRPDPVDPGVLAHNAATRRTHHDRRLAVVGTDHRRLARELREYADGGAPEAVRTGAVTGGRPRVVFVFSGQGSQWVGMGRRLLDNEPVFRRRMAECDEAIRDEVGWSVLELLSSGGPLVTEDVVQPALWAVQLGLAALWRSWGIRPDLLIGHSMGEIAAACEAGSLTVREGAAVVCRRSALIGKLTTPGAMWAVQLGEAEASRAIGGHADRVTVGVVNSDHSTVLAGDPEALEQVVAPLRERGVFCRQVRVRYASHAPQVEPLRADLLAALEHLRPAPARIPVHSTVLDRRLVGDEMDARYWMDNLRRPVLFAQATRAALAEDGPVLFVEVSSHPLLAAAIEDTVIETGAQARAAVVTSLAKDEPEVGSLLTGLAGAYLRGCLPDWAAVAPAGGFVDLPGYPWQERRYWVGRDRPAGPVATTEAQAGPVEPEVFTVDSAGDGDEPAGAAGLEALSEAVRQLSGGDPVVLADVRLPAIPPTGASGYALRTVLRTEPDGWSFDVRVGRSRVGGLSGWTTCVSGRARRAPVAAPAADGPLDLVRSWCREPVPGARAAGFGELARRDGEAVGTVELTGPARRRRLDLLDRCARALRATVPAGTPVTAAPGLTALAELRLPAELPGLVRVHARLHHLAGEDGAPTGDVRVLDASDRLVGELRGLRLAADGPVAAAGRGPVGRRVAGSRAAERAVSDTAPDTADRFVGILAQLLHTTPDDLDRHTPLPQLGMDSMLAARLRGSLARGLGVQLPIRHLLGERTISDLVRELDDRVVTAGAER